MAGFYGLALVVSAGLGWAAYAALADLNPQNAPLVPICLAGALSILWSIVPRRDRFVPPGPRLDPAREPELFSVLQDIATDTSQDMPTDVYIVTTPTAFVTQRGGIMGFGSHRVMGLGLPLMHVLSVQELKAIVAHEFGHFHAGDVALGPWIHKTSAAIDRTLEGLSKSTLEKIFCPTAGFSYASLVRFRGARSCSRTNWLRAWPARTP